MHYKTLSFDLILIQYYLSRVAKNSYKALNLSKKLAFFEVGSEYAISPKNNAISDFTV